MPQLKFHQVWLVPTVYGDAIRRREELVEDGDGGNIRRLGTALSTVSIIPSLIPFAELRTTPFLPSDLPDYTRSRTEVCNVCGFVAGFSAVARHPAWRTVRSTLGSFKEAYTLRAGNLIFLRGKLIFKGAVSWQVVACLILTRFTLRVDMFTAGGAFYCYPSSFRTQGPGIACLSGHRHRLHAAQCVCSQRLSFGGDAVSSLMVSRHAAARGDVQRSHILYQRLEPLSCGWRGWGQTGYGDGHGLASRGCERAAGVA